jgi:hypothetical protein
VIKLKKRATETYEGTRTFRFWGGLAGIVFMAAVLLNFKGKI